MDKTAKYEAMILDMINHMEGMKISNEPKLETKLIIDKENHRYMVVTSGWNEAGNYYHSCSIHIEIINEKLWFYRNTPRLHRISVGQFSRRRDRFLYRLCRLGGR